MTDILTIPAPGFCTAQRFNLWASTTNTKAPLIGVSLVKVCQGSPVNPFVLGCIASVLTDSFHDLQALEQNDFFNTGGKYESMSESIAFALKAAMLAENLDAWIGLSGEQVALVRGRYAKFVKFSESLVRVPDDEPKPIPVPQAPTQPSAPPQSTPVNNKPQPFPPKQNQPTTPPQADAPAWKKAVKWIVGIGTTVVTIGGIFIPDQYEVVIKAVIAGLKALLGN